MSQFLISSSLIIILNGRHGVFGTNTPPTPGWPKQVWELMLAATMQQSVHVKRDPNGSRPFYSWRPCRSGCRDMSGRSKFWISWHFKPAGMGCREVFFLLMELGFWTFSCSAQRSCRTCDPHPSSFKVFQITSAIEIPNLHSVCSLNVHTCPWHKKRVSGKAAILSSSSNRPQCLKEIPLF